MPSIRRQLESEARLWLYGHILTRGYYYTSIWLGTPPQLFSLIVDTGSTVTYVPCLNCTHCGTHQDSPFIPSDSSTFQDINCTSNECPSQSCDDFRRCTYERHYAEKSSSSGILVTDMIDFGNKSTFSSVRVNFGCEYRETGDLYTQKADGILGLGRGALSLFDQLTAKSVTKNVFSICYGGMELEGGTMLFGEVDVPGKTLFTQMDSERMAKNAYYNLILQEISVNGVNLTIPDNVFEQGYGTVLDSGTTFTYFPKPVFQPFISAIQSGVKNVQPVDGPDPKYNDICFSGASTEESGLTAYFPTVDFIFADGVKYTLAPENYLFLHRKIRGAYCVGVFQNGDAGTLLGAISMRNTLVTYDRGAMRVGFFKTNCSTLFDTLPAIPGSEDSPAANEREPSSAQASPPPVPSSPPPLPSSPPHSDEDTTVQVIPSTTSSSQVPWALLGRLAAFLVFLALVTAVTLWWRQETLNKYLAVSSSDKIRLQDDRSSEMSSLT